MEDKPKSRYNRYDQQTFDTLYENLKRQQDALSDYACKDKFALRRRKETFLPARPNFVKDTDRILHCRYFNRYADKTQVFSLYKNDDITRRILHVQIVSRIARSIGRMLNLNQDLIEAIALGHDIGHTPFGHAGERFLSALFFEKRGLYFNHNVHSVRILDDILQLNLTLQTLDGILCHNGEKVDGNEYRPYRYHGDAAERFGEFDARREACCTQKGMVDRLIPGTLEGCVVRISDIIAYLGKDRQDAAILGIELDEPFAENELLGSTNSEFISNIINNLVAGSYGKDYLMLDIDYAKALDYEKSVNYERIYGQHDVNGPYPEIKGMFRRVYERLFDDLENGREDSPVFRHHINKIYRGFSDAEQKTKEYAAGEPNQVVVDFIASMTDDYFIDIHEHLFPGKSSLKYNSYFTDV